MNEAVSERLSAPDPMTAAQAAAAQAFRAARGVAPFGPFVPLLHHPDVMTRLDALGRQLRYEGTLPDDVREIVVLTTAVAWAQAVEWSIHAPIARAAGCTAATLAAIEAGAEPDAPDHQRAAWAFADALHRTRDVSDAVFDRSVAAFGAGGAVELAALCGYYATLAMIMNMARTAH